MPNGNVDQLSVNELAKAVTTALHNAGVSAIGYKQHKRTKSMRSRPLPRYLVDALKHKRNLQIAWKTLSSACNYDQAAVNDAEQAFLEHSKTVETLFKNLRSNKSPIQIFC